MVFLNILKRNAFIRFILESGTPLFQHICIYRFFFPMELSLTDTSAQSLAVLLQLPGEDDICSARE